MKTQDALKELGKGESSLLLGPLTGCQGWKMRLLLLLSGLFDQEPQTVKELAGRREKNVPVGVSSDLTP